MNASVWTQPPAVIGVIALLLLAVAVLFGRRLRSLKFWTPLFGIHAEGEPIAHRNTIPAPSAPPAPPPAVFGPVPATNQSAPVPTPDPTSALAPDMHESVFMSAGYLEAFGARLVGIAEEAGDDLDFIIQEPVEQRNFIDRSVQRGRDGQD